MHWDALAAICSLLALLGVVLGAAWTNGRLTEKVEDHGKQLGDHAELLKEHGETLTEHEVAIGILRDWKDATRAQVH